MNTTIHPIIREDIDRSEAKQTQYKAHSTPPNDSIGAHDNYPPHKQYHDLTVPGDTENNPKSKIITRDL